MCSPGRQLGSPNPPSLPPHSDSIHFIACLVESILGLSGRIRSPDLTNAKRVIENAARRNDGEPYTPKNES